MAEKNAFHFQLCISW